MVKELSGSGKVMAALTLLEGDPNPSELFGYGPSELEEGLNHYLSVLKSRFSHGKVSDLTELVRSWTERSPALPIYQIHPGWILEAVRDESPRIIGLICRYLPGNHVRYLIDNLPKEIRRRLPTLSESFGLPNELMEEVKDFLAQKFFRGAPPSPKESFSCHHIPWMSSRDIRKVIREMGYQIIRNAFHGIDRKALQAFLVRFPLDEAREIRQRLDSGPAVGLPERKRAQEQIVAMNLDVNRPEDLPFEIGLYALARTVDPEDRQWIEGVVVRLAPQEGYCLRRYVREALAGRRAEDYEERQTEMLGLISDMAERKLIARYWRMGSDDEVTQG